MHAAAAAAAATASSGGGYELYGGGHMDSASSRTGTPQMLAAAGGAKGYGAVGAPVPRQSHLGTTAMAQQQAGGGERFSASSRNPAPGGKPGGGAGRGQHAGSQHGQDGGYGGRPSMPPGQPLLYQTNAAAGASKLSRAPSRGDPWQGQQGAAGRASGQWEGGDGGSAASGLRASGEAGADGRPFSRGMMQPGFGQGQMWPQLGLQQQQQQQRNQRGY
jgi:hypothetical protein